MIALRELLIPRPHLTPNSLEARRLAAEEGEEGEGTDLAECAKRITPADAICAVTGTHEITAGRQHPLRPERRRAQRFGRDCRHLPRFGLHNRSAIAANHRQRARGERRRKDAQEYPGRR